MPPDMTVTVRITKRTHLQLRLLSATTGRTIHDLVAEAVTAHYHAELDQHRQAVADLPAGRDTPTGRR